MAVFGYARVSSNTQNLSRQIEALKPYITDERYLYCDKASGKDFNRKAWGAFVGTETTLAAMRPGDCVVVLDLDRISRSYLLIQQAWKHITQTLGCDIKVINMPLLDTTNNNGNLDRRFISDLVLQILSYVSERERLNTRSRQKQGIRLALERGIHFGKKAIPKPEGWDDAITQVKSGTLTATAAMRQLGLKRTTYYKLLRQDRQNAA